MYDKLLIMLKKKIICSFFKKKKKLLIARYSKTIFERNILRAHFSNNYTGGVSNINIFLKSLIRYFFIK